MGIKSVVKTMCGDIIPYTPNVYIVKLLGNYYKYGYSQHVRNRILTHRRTLGAKNILDITKCSSVKSMKKSEKNFERYAKKKGILKKIFGSKEIVKTKDPEKMKKKMIEIVNKNNEKYPKDNNSNNKENPKVNFICQDCGRKFRDNFQLNQHKKRKTPCLVSNDPNENIKKPQCEYCNRTFYNNGNLNKHYVRCKVKVNKKHINAELKDSKDILKEQQKILEKQRAEIEKLKQQIKITQLQQQIEKLLI